MPAYDDADFSSYELGHDHPLIEVDTSDAVARACVAMFGAARREIVIMSRDLDPGLFDNPATSLVLRQFLLSSQHARLRILVKNPESVARKGHRIIELAQRLSSFVEIRVPAADFDSQNMAFVVVDGTGVVYREMADRYEASVSFSDRKFAQEMLRRFEEMWQTSGTAPSLRRLAL